MVNANKTPKRNVAMLARATSTARLPPVASREKDTTPTMIPTVSDGQRTASPLRSDRALKGDRTVDRSPVIGSTYSRTQNPRQSTEPAPANVGDPSASPPRRREADCQ